MSSSAITTICFSYSCLWNKLLGTIVLKLRFIYLQNTGFENYFKESIVEHPKKDIFGLGSLLRIYSLRPVYHRIMACSLWSLSYRWVGSQVFLTQLFPKWPSDDFCVHLPPETPVNGFVVGNKLMQPKDPRPLSLKGTLEFVLSSNLEYSVWVPFKRSSFSQSHPTNYQQSQEKREAQVSGPRASPLPSQPAPHSGSQQPPLSQ